MKKVHFMGISGSGQSAVAALAKVKGYEVSGCDEESDGHSKTHVKGINLLCVSPSVFYLNSESEEVVEAKENNIPIVTWQKFMGEELFKDKYIIAVAGTHGKTTTVGLVGILLEEAGFDPWVEVGGIVKNWNQNYRVSSTDSKYFVCEADEFYDNFLNIHSDIIILNNIEFDHPEFFKTEERMYESFVKFILNSKQNAKLIVNMDSKGIVQLRSYQIAEKRKDIEIVQFNSSYVSENQDIFAKLQIFGNQNIQNAAGVLKLAETLNIPKEKVISVFQNFQGIKRRQDLLGEVNSIKIYDDYAHHPTAVFETIKAFREKFPNEKITVVIQPHTYSRLKYLFEDFKTCAREADLVIYTDVFASREKGNPTISSKNLVDVIAKSNVEYIPFDKITEYLLKKITGGIVIFMGAGDIIKISSAYFYQLKGKK